MFRKLTREDERAFDAMIAQTPELYAGYYGSELCFDTLWQWQEAERMNIEVGEHAVLIRGFDPELPPEDLVHASYIFPYADSVDSFLAAVRGIVAREGEATILTCLSAAMVELLRPLYPTAVFEPWPELAEYLYRSEDLATFAGKRYHGKRNFVTRFTERYAYELRSYGPELRPDVEQVLRVWSEEKGEILPDENRAIALALDKRERLDIDLLYIEGRIEAFLIGGRCRDFYDLMFFKCNTEFPGIYPFLLNSYVRRHCMDVPFVNMQEDMGIEGLRKSKESYHPAFLQEKYIMRFAKEEGK